ncbi:amino acid adenylation domain-containing protein [Paenibacillus profundus]|uniref:Amino acid adenylation domain-containing protein n=1 Tax=Paenibacillus profundus TaxID=1173085 RepID=A0ABS8YE07_9BACL|nr:non-ribosomal peptide synthetase [Paenibacillus profundus]MCE5169787.1 amino acid adenylation domain-containing protein [Paenibacillus profundus]
MSKKNELETRRSHLSDKQRLLLEQWKQGTNRKKQWISPRKEEDGLLLSPAQRRLWFLDQLLADKSAYNMYFAVRLTGTVDLQAARSSFQFIIDRHESLRINFTNVNGSPQIKRMERFSLDLPVEDVSGLQAHEAEEAANVLIQRAISEPFDLEREPLLRARFIRLKDQEHILMLCMHHIISDGWSMGLLVKEWMTCYTSYLAGAAPVLTPLPIQYGDFAYWQSEQLSSGKWDGHLSYWKGKLNQCPSVALLPDRKITESAGNRGGEVLFDLPDEWVQLLKSFCAKTETTLFMVLLTMFGGLLYRYTHEQTMVIGTPIANRNYTEIEGVIGYFVNLLPLRLDISGEMSFHDLLHQVVKAATEAYDHQDFPFDRVIEELQPDRQGWSIPLVRNMFVFQNTPAVEIQLPHVRAEMLKLHNRTSKSDVLLSMTEMQGAITGRIEYNADLFVPQTMRNFANHFIEFIRSALTYPDRPIGLLNLLQQDEQADIIQRSGRMAVQEKDPECLQQQFERIAAQFPEHTALKWNDEIWTYSELNDHANRLACHLRQSGASHGQFVGLCMNRSPYLIASILAVLKAGCAYVPIDPAYPEERIRWMVSDSGCSLLLVDDDTHELLSEASCTRIQVTAEELEIAKYSAENLNTQTSETDVAYMIYTSGSTGLPKGVLVEHGSVSRLFISTQRLFEFHDQDVWTLYHSCAFDFSVWEIWGALLHGGRLVIVPFDVTRSFEDFYRLLVREQVTVLNQTPSAFKQLMHIEQHPGMAGSTDLSLRYIIFGGEALELQSLRPWFDIHGDRHPQLINMYGITEITVHATYRPLSIADLEARSGSVIGMPLPDLQAYILDEHQQPVPVGVAGELYIGGRGVARGYWKREELNKERFIANPFAGAGSQSGRLYCSGDLARWTAAGEIEYLGRRDEQVKIRGFRIELGEIEGVVGEHELVSQNVAVVDRNEHGDPKITCYLIPQKNRLHTIGPLVQMTHDMVDRWETVFDSYYTKGNEHDDKTFHIVGWNDTFTGQPIPAVEMEEWTNETVKRILKYKPKRVLEIGCGTGLLLFRVAPFCESYIGTDLSEKAIEYVDSHLHVLGDARDRVELYKCNAHELPDLEQVDMIILNSVVQYFPDLSYLHTVLQHSAGRVKPGGCIFMGDICGFMFREAFHSSVVLNGVDDQTTMSEFSRLVQRKMKQHSELMLDSGYFLELQQRLPEIKAVEVLYKKGAFHNEMSKFRFDSVLHIGEKAVWEPEASYDWSPGVETLLNGGELCRQHPQACFLIKGIPNSRVVEEWSFLRWCRQANPKDKIADYRKRSQQGGDSPKGIEPEAMVQWGGHSHNVEMLLSEAVHEGCLDVIFTPNIGGDKIVPFPNMDAKKAGQQLSSVPLQQEVENKLVAIIRDEIQKRLPDYMIPAQFVVLEQFPLTANGKIERGKLRELKPNRSWAGQTPEHDQLPHTVTEKALQDMWLSLLDVDQVGMEDHFFEIGGHSLLISQMMFQIKKQFQVHIPLMQLMLEPTIKSIARQIDRSMAQEAPDVQLDLASKVVLDPAIQGAGVPLAPQTECSQSVLLTGGTGFFGAFLLHELLQKPDTQVYCLVRADNREAGMQKLISGMKKYLLWKDDLIHRITVITGDLGTERLGLDEATYNFLTKQITSIYHNGATVNFAYPYSALEAANVKGCESILRLAAAGSLKPVHYISTLYVFSEEDAKNKKIILEDDVPIYFETLKLGYTQSKWVAEGLMREGRNRGLPINIYRLGRISGDSRTGVCQDSDFFWKIVRFCLQLGAFPDIDFRFNLIPADFAGTIIVQLAHDPLYGNQTFHVMNDHDCSFKEIVGMLLKLGYSFEQLPWDNWKRAVSDLSETGTPEQVDISVLPFIEELSMIEGEAPIFSANNTFAFLKNMNIDCPQMDEKRLKTYIEYFVDSGYFESITI